MTIGERIRKLRKQRGWTQVEFAEKLGVHDRHISRLEKRVAHPNERTLKKLLEIFGMTEAELWGHPPTPLPPDDPLLEQFQQIQQLTEEERGAIRLVIDAFLTKRRMENALRPAGKAKVG